MGIFDKALQTGKNIGKAVSTAAIDIGAVSVTNTKEQSELLALKSEVNVIDHELDASYAMIGKKYVDFLINNSEAPCIDIQDVLKIMDPKMQRKQDLENQIIELEKRLKEQNALRERQQAQAEFEQEKTKLDKALAMGIMEQADYESKISVLQKKLDNFDTIRKLEQQVEMGIITKEEKEEKLFLLLN